eukprot:755442-Hanusia_phi.AAC.6
MGSWLDVCMSIPYPSLARAVKINPYSKRAHKNLGRGVLACLQWLTRCRGSACEKGSEHFSGTLRCSIENVCFSWPGDQRDDER